MPKTAKDIFEMTPAKELAVLIEQDIASNFKEIRKKGVDKSQAVNEAKKIVKEVLCKYCLDGKMRYNVFMNTATNEVNVYFLGSDEPDREMTN